MAGSRRRDFSRRRFIVAGVNGIAITLLAGCASIDRAPGGDALVPDRSISPASFFTLRGRISVRVNDKLESGQILWTRLGTEERIELFTPFGNQVAELVKPRDGRVTLRRGHEIDTAASMEDLTRALLGVSLDLDAMARWTQGVGLVDGVAAERKFLNGDAWQVTADRLQPRGGHQFASRVSAIRGDIVVRLVIDEWRAE